jgi:hypothetical protein
MAPKDLLTRLADAGEGAISKLGDSPGIDRMMTFANSTRERLDDLSRRVRGVEDLQRRVERLEQRVDELSGTPSEPSAALPPPEQEPAEAPAAEAAAHGKAAAAGKGTAKGKTTAAKKAPSTEDEAADEDGSTATAGGDSPG